MRFDQTTPPSERAVALEDVKQHLRVDMLDDDNLIQGLIDAATTSVEDWTGRQLVTAGYTGKFKAASCVILPKPPAIEILAVNGPDGIVDPSGYELDNLDTLDRHRVLFDSTPAGPLNIEWTAGYGTAAQVPEVFKSAIKLIVGDLYENREQTIVGTITADTGLLKRLLFNERVGVL